MPADDESEFVKRHNLSMSEIDSKFRKAKIYFALGILLSIAVGVAKGLGS